MAREFGLTVWISAIVVVTALAAPPFTAADDTKATTQTGIDAKAAFARIKTLAGTWNSRTSDEHKAEHAKAEEEDHKGEQPVIYKLTGAGSALWKHSFPAPLTRWFQFTTSTVTTCE